MLSLHLWNDLGNQHNSSGANKLTLLGLGMQRDQKENRQARIEIDWEDVNRESVEYGPGFVIPSLSCVGVNALETDLNSRRSSVATRFSHVARTTT